MDGEKTGAVIAAAGASERMAGVDKLFQPVSGRSILARVLDCLQGCTVIDVIVVVLAETNLSNFERMQNGEDWSKVSSICSGGVRRQDSVKAGLDLLAGCRWVVIHDGARPLLTPDLIERGVAEAKAHGAAIAAVPVKETIKRTSSEGFVLETPAREGLWTIQTPQVFDYDLIRRAHQLVSEDVTDDAAMVEKLGHPVKLYPGSYENVKITTPEDLVVAEAILRNR